MLSPMAERLTRLLASRRARRTALLALLWTAIALFLFAVREVLLPFFLAAFLGYVIDPLVRRLSAMSLRGFHLPRWASVLAVYAGFFAALWLLMVFFVPELYREVLRLAKTTASVAAKIDHEQIQRAAERLDTFFERARLPVDVIASASDVPAAEPGAVPLEVDAITGSPVQTAMGARPLLPEAIEPLEEGQPLYTLDLGRIARAVGKTTLGLLKEQTGTIASKLQHLVGGVVGFVFKFFLVLMITGFILADVRRIERFFFSIVPMEDRARFDDLLARIDRGLSGVVRGQITICLVNGALTLVGLLLFDVKFAFSLASIAAIFSLVPIFGSILSTIPIVVIALATGGFVQAVLILLWIIGIHLVEANFLNPKIMGEAARIHPVLVVLALVAGEHFYGIVGALFAVPIASIGLTIFKWIQARALALEDDAGGPPVVRRGPRLRIWRERVP